MRDALPTWQIPPQPSLSLLLPPVIDWGHERSSSVTSSSSSCSYKSTTKTGLTSPMQKAASEAHPTARLNEEKSDRQREKGPKTKSVPSS